MATSVALFFIVFELFAIYYLKLLATGTANGMLIPISLKRFLNQFSFFCYGGRRYLFAKERNKENELDSLRQNLIEVFFGIILAYFL